MTWAFCDQTSANRFQGEQDQLIQIANPISHDLSVMRPSILPHLIAAIRDNANRGQGHGHLFETGATYRGLTPSDQQTEIAIVRSGRMGADHWLGDDRPVDFYDIKADVINVLDELGAPVDQPPLTRDIPNYYHPGRAAAIQLGPHRLAQFGEIHPSVLADYDIEAPVVAAEVYPMNLPGMPEMDGPHKGSLNLSPYQPVARDFAFILNADQPADSVINLIQSVDRELIQAVNFFDLYTGENLEDGQKSLACRVRIQPTESTMTEDEIDAISDKIIQKVTKKLNATLRSA
jgi:phenylalanyl-tRNA synthetase beta chain